MNPSQPENTKGPIGLPAGADTPTSGSPLGIKVIGIGLCGRNAVEDLIRGGVTGIECIFVTADGGAISPPLHDIEAAISGAHVLFIVAGLGGHTGGAAALVIANAVRAMGILTVGVVFTPFEFEGQKRNDRAEASLHLLDASLSMVTVVSNNKLLTLTGNLSQDEAFSAANAVLKNAVRGMVDITAVMPHGASGQGCGHVSHMPGRALIGCASATGPFRASTALARALECPLVTDQVLHKGKAVLVVLTAAEKSLELGEFSHARNLVLERWPTTTRVVFETDFDNTLKGKVRVSVMVTGISNLPASPR